MIDLNDPTKQIDVLPERKDQVLQTSAVQNSKLLVKYMVNASDSFQIYDLGLNHPEHLAQHLHTIPLPGFGTVGGGGSSDPNEKMMFYTYTSFTVPSMQFKLDLDTYKNELVSEITIQPKVGKPDDYITEQVWYKSKDGTQVPMFLVRKKKTLPDLESVPKKPIVTNLYAYGGFGSSTQPEYSPTLMTLLNDMGGMYAVANIRGGGEFGEKWHTSGIKDKRQNVFDDFIAAGEFLIEKQFTDSKNLFIQGGSNGGTLVTAVANQRPGLFAGVIG